MSDPVYPCRILGEPTGTVWGALCILTYLILRNSIESKDLLLQPCK